MFRMSLCFRLCVGVLCLTGVSLSADLKEEPQEQFSPEKFRKHIDKLNQPEFPIEFPEVEDRLHRRGKGVVMGTLKSLLAFATVELPRLKSKGQPVGPIEMVRISRDEINFILLDGNTFPNKPPLLAVEEDSVLLKNDEVLSGMVSITNDQISVAGQNVPAEDVRLIHLTQKSQDFHQAQERNSESPEEEPPAPESQSETESEEHPSSDSDKEACWVGEINVHQFTTNQLPFKMEKREWNVRYLVILHETRDPYGWAAGLEVKWLHVDARFRQADELHRNGTLIKYAGFSPIQLTAQGKDLPGFLKSWGGIRLRDVPKQKIQAGQYRINPHVGFLGDLMEIKQTKSFINGSAIPAKGTPNEFRYEQPYAPNTPAIGMQDGSDALFFSDPQKRKLQQGGTLMEGSWQIEAKSKVVPHLINQYEVSWKLRRTTDCPSSLPLGGNDDEDKDPCEHLRLRVDAANSFLERMKPRLKELQELEADALNTIKTLYERMAFYRKDFIAALRLAGIEDVSFKILWVFAPARLAKGFGVAGSARVTGFFSGLSLAQIGPGLWTLSKASPNAYTAYQVYQRYQILDEFIEGNYEPTMEYLDEHLNKWAPDNPIGIGAEKFLNAARDLVPTLRKLALVREDRIKLQPDIKEAKLKAEFWEKQLEACLDKHGKTE